MAFASIFVPHFMLQAVVRTDSALRERALVLIDGNPPSSSVVAVNERAARMGIEPGMAKANAAQFAGVEIRPRSRAQEKIAHAALLDIGWSVSPRIEDAAEDAIVLDLAGLTGIFGSEKDIGTRLDALSSECGLSLFREPQVLPAWQPLLRRSERDRKNWQGRAGDHPPAIEEFSRRRDRGSDQAAVGAPLRRQRSIAHGRR